VELCPSNTLFSNATHKRIVTTKRPYDNVLYQLFNVLNLLYSFILFNIFNKSLAKIYTRCECRKVLSFCSTVLDPFSVFVEKEVRNKRTEPCFSGNLNVEVCAGNGLLSFKTAQLDTNKKIRRHPSNLMHSCN
jgi:hypothetical protein